MVVLGLIERVQKWRKQMCEKKEETWREPEDYIEHGNFVFRRPVHFVAQKHSKLLP